MSRCVKIWQCVSERIVVVQLKIGTEWTAFVQVYAPTDDCSKELKLGMALEDDLHKNQKKFWNTVRGQNNGGAEVKKVCEEKVSQVNGKDERVVDR